MTYAARALTRSSRIPNSYKQGEPVVLVTGGAGYIGSHAALCLQMSGFRVVVLDNLVQGHKNVVENALGAELIVGDVGNRALLDSIFAAYNVIAVMHFAAYAYVGESVTSPAKYYRNNVVSTLTLLEAMQAANINTLIFSSTCATYGLPITLPITEEHPQQPINPYGISKLTVERMLSDFGRAYGLQFVIFRYFNAAGADPFGQLGENHQPETHLIPLALQVASGQFDAISIFGTDYPTPDGTCIRDYIHVSDLARAHVAGLQHLLNGGSSEAFNLSNGDGFSVKEVIATVRNVTSRPVAVRECPRRLGDPPILVGSADKASAVLNWQPQYAELKTIVAHAWQWFQIRQQVSTLSRSCAHASVRAM